MIQRHHHTSWMVAQCIMLASCVGLASGCSSATPSSDSNSAGGTSGQSPVGISSGDTSSGESAISGEGATGGQSGQVAEYLPVDAPENGRSGPHGGILVPVETLQLEFEVLIDRTEQSISVYSRSSDKKRPVALEAKQLLVEITVPKMRIQLRQVPQVGEPPDKSSLYRGTDAKLATTQQLSGTLTGQVDDTDLKLRFHELPSHSGDF